MVKDVKYSKEFCEQSIFSEGGITWGMATPQNGTDIRLNTTQNNNYRKTETELKLAKNI